MRYLNEKLEQEITAYRRSPQNIVSHVPLRMRPLMAPPGLSSKNRHGENADIKMETNQDIKSVNSTEVLSDQPLSDMKKVELLGKLKEW